MTLAHEKGIPIKSTCNGLPSCAECRVRIVDGDWNTNPPSRKELNLIGTGYYIDQRRLSCQLLCFGDITVDTTEQIEKASEGPVTKKFLSKVHKASAEESHSLGGVLIETDEALLQQLKNDVPNAPAPEKMTNQLEVGGGGSRPQRDMKRSDRGNGGRGGYRRGGRSRGRRGGNQGNSHAPGGGKK